MIQFKQPLFNQNGGGGGGVSRPGAKLYSRLTFAILEESDGDDKMSVSASL